MTDTAQENAKTTATGQTVPPAEPGAQQDNDLNISDLNAMKMIIDVASTRGAFKPSEMVLVGQTYNKLVGFLNAAQKGQTNG